MAEKTEEQLQQEREADEKTAAEEKAEADRIAKEETERKVKEEAAKISIEDTGIQLNKKTYSLDEVKQFINESIRKGAKISKDQLYTEIEKLQKKLKDVSTATQEETKEQQKTINATIEELQKKLNLMEDEAAKAMHKAETVETQLQRERLENFRKDLIASANGKIIEALVQGNNEEELKASLENAKKEYEKVVGSVRQNFKLPTEEEIETQRKQEEENNQPVEISRLHSRDDMLDWKKKKDELLRKAYTQAGFPVQ